MHDLTNSTSGLLWYLGTTCVSSLLWIFIAHPLTTCAGKKTQGPPAGYNPAPGYVSKTCNKKAGLCNDDPDLKSEKLMAATGVENKPKVGSSNEKVTGKSNASDDRNKASGSTENGKEKDKEKLAKTAVPIGPSANTKPSDTDTVLRSSALNKPISDAAGDEKLQVVPGAKNAVPA